MPETDATATLKNLHNGVTLNIVNSATLPDPAVFLSSTEIKKYNSFKVPKRRTDWLGGRYAAKTLLTSIALREAPVSIEISYDDFGRPRAAGQLISISHSNGWAVAAIKAGGGDFIGVDIEAIEERSEAWRSDYFTPGELKEGGPSEATKTWTVKEAALKALGLGLKADLRDARVINGALSFHGAALERHRALGVPVLSADSLLFKNAFWITAVSA